MRLFLSRPVQLESLWVNECVGKMSAYDKHILHPVIVGQIGGKDRKVSRKQPIYRLSGCSFTYWFRGCEIFLPSCRRKALREGKAPLSPPAVNISSCPCFSSVPFSSSTAVPYPLMSIFLGCLRRCAARISITASTKSNLYRSFCAAVWVNFLSPYSWISPGVSEWWATQAAWKHCRKPYSLFTPHRQTIRWFSSQPGGGILCT